MGITSRNKGKRGEREAAAEIRRLFKVDARRGIQFCGGSDSPDVVHGIHGVHIEVKRVEAIRLYDALQQAIDDADEKIPVVLHRKNGKPWVAIVSLDDLPRLAVQCYLTLAADGGAGEAETDGMDESDESDDCCSKCQGSGIDPRSHRPDDHGPYVPCSRCQGAG